MAQSYFPESNNTNGRKLRQRRARILNDKKEDERIEGIIKESIVSSSQHSGHILKTFLVIITALCCTVGVLLRHKRPNLLNRFWKKPVPTYHFATKYPNYMVLERDLPRFFRYYSIATPDNELAQKAVRKVLLSRKQLRRRAGRINSIVKAWDASNIENLLNQRICGDEFEVAFRNGNQQRKDDLLMWCLMASRVTEGFFMESVDMIDSALFLTRNRGIVVMRQPPAGIADGHGALSTSFYLHPRTDNAAIDWIPAKILAMLISGSEEVADSDSSDTQEMVQKLLYELVVTQGNEKDFLILEEVCQESRPERSIAVDTSGNDADGCYFVVPEKYGGNFKAGVGQ